MWTLLSVESVQCGPCCLSRLLTRACALPCSEVFGSHLDIHTGGIDLAFPHHENEIAQSEVFHQCPQWGNYFLHSGEPDWRLTYLLSGSVSSAFRSLLAGWGMSLTEIIAWVFVEYLSFLLC